jgi:methionyl-tRNA synthetase
MTDRYRSGRLPAGHSGSERLPGVAAQALADYRSAMDRLALHEGVAAAFRIIDAANLFIADTQPWALAKDDAQSDRLTGVLAEAAEAVRVASVLLLPVMPASAGEIVRRMGDSRPSAELRLTDAAWRSGERHIINAGPMWPRRDLGASIVTDMPKEPASGEPGAPAAPVAPVAPVPGLTQAAAPAPVDDRISIEDFMKVELRVARVVEAERVPKSKKLVKMAIDVGTDRRTIVAGIAEAYEPEALIGKTVVIVANLKPAKLMGIESNGMVLAASPDGGLPIVINAEPAAPGTRVR